MINKTTFSAVLIALGLMMGMFTLTSPIANATANGDVAEVLTAKVGFSAKAFKKKGCKAYAAKREQQAPPRDPQALCKGKLKVTITGTAVTPPCPTGYFGGSAQVSVRLVQSIKARAFAKSIASGRVQTWAKFKIRDKAMVDGSAQSTCVKTSTTPPPPVAPPVTPPPVTPPVTPPPPVTPKATISLDVLNDVDETDPNCQGTRDQCESFVVSAAHATVPNGVAGTLRISSNIGTVGFTPAGTLADWRDDVTTMNLTAGQYDPKYRFNAPTEGSSATITLTFAPNGGGEIVTATTTVVINDTPPVPL